MRRYRWLAVGGWMLLIFVLSAQPDLPQPASGWLEWLISSGAHAFVFGVLAVLLAWALGQRRRVLVVAFGLTLLYALSDEFHQAFVPGRQPDLMDIGCDALGAALGLALWDWWHRFRQQREAGRPGPGRAG
jgi:VanZ family protein